MAEGQPNVGSSSGTVSRMPDLYPRMRGARSHAVRRRGGDGARTPTRPGGPVGTLQTGSIDTDLSLAGGSTCVRPISMQNPSIEVADAHRDHTPRLARQRHVESIRGFRLSGS